MKNIFLAFGFFCWALLRLDAQTCTPVVDCNPNPFGYCDETPNDDNLWNQSYWWDPTNLQQDLTDGPFEHSIVATDSCGAGLTIRYLLFLDLDNNGTQETVIKSWEPPAAGTINFNNAANPDYNGGDVRIFDGRPVATDGLYAFTIEQSTVGNTVTATIKWNTGAAPGTYKRVELPTGNHKLKWLISNSFNNEKVCEHTINMTDCKKPTVVCINGISVNIMPTGMITLWASDFLQYTEDNATPTPQLKSAIRKLGAADGQGNTTGFPRNADGSPQTGLDFSCAELGIQEVELWSIDLTGNADYCQVFVIIQDNLGNCPGTPSPIVQACVKCENGQVGSEPVTLTMEIQRPGLPPLTLQNGPTNPNCITNQQASIPIGSSYTITPSNNTNPINGMSTYDIVLIARHLLGLDILNSPYKLIAADVDRSNFVGVGDLVQMKRLILGIYTELPQNTSWRFVPKNYVFPNPNFPSFPPFPEKIEVTNVSDTIPVSFEFKSIKIGDVNGTAICNGFAPGTEDRSNVSISIPDLNLAAGEEVDLPLRFTEAGEWLGFQIGLRFNPSLLEVVQVTPGNLPQMNSSYISQPAPGLVRMLWFDAESVALLPDQAVSTVRVRALAPVSLKDEVTLTNDQMTAEAYDAALKTSPLQLVFAGKTNGTNELSATTILAPQPNPTADGFSIPVRLGEAATVQVQVTDLTGKTLYQTELPCTTGSHLLAVPAAALPQAGVYGWRVQVGNEAKSGKVVRM